MGQYEFSKVCHALHVNKNFGNLEDAPWHRDAVYPRFSEKEYRRRHEALRGAMREKGLDCLIVGGSCNLMSVWGGVVWLSGHMDHRSVSNYVVFPFKGEPALLYPMAGTHIWAVKQQAIGVKDVRSSRGAGGFGKAMAARIKELGLENGTIGFSSINMEGWGPEFLPVNYYLDIQEACPKARLVLVPDIFHKLWYRKSEEEIAFFRKAGELCDRAVEAIAERAKPGVTERQLAASASFAMSDGGGYPQFLIVGITSMSNPAQIFGNPNPSDRVLEEGDLINNELAAGYGGVTAQIGNPICVGKPTEAVKKLWEEAVLPSAQGIEAVLRPGKTLEDIRAAGNVIVKNGYTGRPTLVHGIDIATSHPHVWMEDVAAHEYEKTLQPGMVIMSEPNPATTDGRLGMFFGRTYVITERGNERVTKLPFELISV